MEFETLAPCVTASLTREMSWSRVSDANTVSSFCISSATDRIHSAVVSHRYATAQKRRDEGERYQVCS